MDMKVNAEITANREIKIYVDLSEENEGASTSNPNAWVSNIEIFNTKSYLDGVAVYQKEYESTGQGAFVSPLVMTDHDLNLFDTLVNTDNCHSTDMLNDIIIVNVTLGYSDSYEITHDCSCNDKYAKTIALYYPCPIYSEAINAIGGCNCKDMCEDNLPYGFMYALLKKKAIDMCIECGHYDQACRYYLKFYKTDNCNCTKPCGCGNKSGSSTEYTATTDKSTTKNCGCHG